MPQRGESSERSRPRARMPGSFGSPHFACRSLAPASSQPSSSRSNRLPSCGFQTLPLSYSSTQVCLVCTNLPPSYCRSTACTPPVFSPLLPPRVRMGPLLAQLPESENTEGLRIRNQISRALRVGPPGDFSGPTDNQPPKSLSSGWVQSPRRAPIPPRPHPGEEPGPRQFLTY